MINLQSILSLFDDKPTLLKWLKKVEAALAASVLTSVTISQPSETTAVLTFNFEDGTNIETPAITLPRGASVVNAMLDANNNLILVLDDGRQINVGNIMPANINAQNGTFSVSLTSPDATLSVAHVGNLFVTTNIESESASFAGTIDAGGYYTEGNLEVEGNAEIDGNIDAGGNVSVTGSVTAASFSGENAKPIYCHPITISYSGAYKGSFKCRLNVTCLIFNNSPTPFTWSTFLQFVRDLAAAAPNSKIMTSGHFMHTYNSNFEIPNVDTPCQFIHAVTSTNIQLQGAVYTNVDTVNANILGLDGLNVTLFEDGVNKLN